MKCSQCGNELIQGNYICPSCGKDNTPEVPAAPQPVQESIVQDNIEMPQMHQAEQTPDTSASVLDEGPVEVSR